MSSDEGVQVAIAALSVFVVLAGLAGVLGPRLTGARRLASARVVQVHAAGEQSFTTRYLSGWFDKAESEARLATQIVSQGYGNAHWVRLLARQERRIGLTTRLWARGSARRGEAWAILQVLVSVSRRVLEAIVVGLLALLFVLCVVIAPFVLMAVVALRPRATIASHHRIAARVREGKPAFAFNVSWDDRLQAADAASSCPQIQTAG